MDWNKLADMDWNKLADALIHNLTGYAQHQGDKLLVSEFGLRAALMIAIEDQAIHISIHKPDEPIQYPDKLKLAEGIEYQRVS